MGALRKLDAMTQQLRFEKPEWFPDDMPDPRPQRGLPGPSSQRTLIAPDAEQR